MGFSSRGGRGLSEGVRVSPVVMESTHLGSFLARTLASNLRPFRATYSASLSMTGWMSGGGGIMAAAEAGDWVAVDWGAANWGATSLLKKKIRKKLTYV